MSIFIDMEKYRKARDELYTYIEGIAKKFCDDNDIGYLMNSRIKSKSSIINKLKNMRKNNINSCIDDIAGIRVVFCSKEVGNKVKLDDLDKYIHSLDKNRFVDEFNFVNSNTDVNFITYVYKFIDILKNDDKFNVCYNSEKDYIKNPKESGYQSYHLNFVSSNGITVEVQIRDIVQHLFAEYEHDIRYKNSNENSLDDEILVSCAKLLGARTGDYFGLLSDALCKKMCLKNS